jgi:hypothetical protein
MDGIVVRVMREGGWLGSEGGGGGRAERRGHVYCKPTPEGMVRYDTIRYDRYVMPSPNHAALRVEKQGFAF